MTSVHVTILARRRFQWTIGRLISGMISPEHVSSKGRLNWLASRGVVKLQVCSKCQDMNKSKPLSLAIIMLHASVIPQTHACTPNAA